MRRLIVLGLALTAIVTAGAWPAQAADRPRKRVSVIAVLDDYPAARTAQGRAARPRLVAASQRRLVARVLAAVPSAEVGWRYRLVLNAIAVSVDREDVRALADVPGIDDVYPSVGYAASLNGSTAVIRAPELWQAGVTNSGAGLKIGIIDDGIDPRSPLFDPAGLVTPQGFPRGDARFTSAKIIVARAFPPPDAALRAASLPYDRKRSRHGTHVAGIAAGNGGVIPPVIAARPPLPLSGVAPRASLGNYRAMTVPTESGVGLNGNSPEIIAAIEAAVADGMDVINLSLGQPEITPGRDLVAKALDNAAALGVVPVVSAGNDYLELGLGSVSSPGTAERAITVGAVSSPRVFGVDAAPSSGANQPLAAPVGLFPIPGTGAPRLTDVTVRLRAPEADPASCVAIEPVLPGAAAATVILATESGCGLARKARRAAHAGASALIVASSTPAGYRVRPAKTALPVFVAPSSTVADLAAQARSNASPLLHISSRPSVIVTGDGAGLAPFSASGPTPLSLRPKPDLVAPGVNILSAVPVRDGSYGVMSGTSMSAPHVAGGAALLRELHPDWSVEQVKSALMVSARNVYLGATSDKLASTARSGAGFVDLVAASDPRIFTSPQSVSLGLIRPGELGSAQISLADAGGGSGVWDVTVSEDSPSNRVAIRVGKVVTVPGTVTVAVSVAGTAPGAEHSGSIVLEQDGVRRRVPYWFRVARTRLNTRGASTLRRAGTYAGDTSGRRARVDRYRYPERPWAAALAGPEQTFAVNVTRPVANLGVAIIKRSSGVGVEPRIVMDGDENRLAGAGSLPFVANPFQRSLGGPALIAAVLKPQTGRYTVVFDSRSRQDAGAFRFRFWINDLVPPTIHVPDRVARGEALRVRVRDRGSGVDPRSLLVRVDQGGLGPAVWDRKRREIRIDTRGLAAGRHTVVVRAADRQEAKNTENTGPILPNTREVTASFVVRGPA